MAVVDGLANASGDIVLLVAVNRSQTTRIFGRLSRHRIRALDTTVTGIARVSGGRLASILTRFRRRTRRFTTLGVGTGSCLHSMLIGTLNRRHTTDLLRSVLRAHSATDNVRALGFVRPRDTTSLVHSRRPRVVTAVLIRLGHTRTTSVLTLFSRHLHRSIVLHVTAFNNIRPTTLTRLARMLGNLLSNRGLGHDGVNNIEATTRVVGLVGARRRRTIVATIHRFSNRLTRGVVSRVFLFRGLISISSHDVRHLLRRISSRSLLVTLGKTRRPLHRGFLHGVSRHTTSVLHSSLTGHNPIHLSRIRGRRGTVLLVIHHLTRANRVMVNDNRSACI